MLLQRPRIKMGSQARPGISATQKRTDEVFVILCASGFDNIARARSALMFASLAAAAEYKAVLYCIQTGVDIMVKGAIEKNEKLQSGTPTLADRLREALALGVKIQCCSQTLANKGLTKEDLIEEVQIAGAMNLIELTARASGSLSF